MASAIPQSLQLPRTRHLLCALLLGASVANGIDVQFTDPNSVKKAAGQIAFDLMSYYKGNVSGGTPGLLPDSGQAPNGYFWWEGGSMFGSMIDYWYFTGDPTYNAVSTKAMQFQVGPQNNFEPQNQTFDLGNDDQAFWAMAAMTGAEEKFPNPPQNEAQWLALAQAVFNRQVPRWDNATCAGGLRWQFNPINAGYSYKSTIANACLMNLGARLGRYTGNQTYFQWAETIYDWCKRVDLIDSDYNVFDGTSIDQNCTVPNRLQWTYNVGLFLDSAAFMWNATGSAKWQQETQGLLKGTNFFFNEAGIMVEQMCEAAGNCNTDQLSYKSLLIRWMAETAKLAPFTATDIQKRLATTCPAAASCCKCGDSGTQCGFSWTKPGTCDGSYGIGQQLNALQAVQVNLENLVGGAVNSSGGISQGNANAGGGNDNPSTMQALRPATTGDKAGASILSIIVVVAFVGGAVWIVI